MTTKLKYLISLLLTASILGSMLIFPAFASGFSALLNVGDSSYLLGETISFTGVVGFATGESATLTGVTLVIDGPYPLTKQLPVQEGTYSYPDDDLVVTVSYNGVSLTGGQSTGYGYGYGYTLQAGAAGGSINYAIEWQPPYMLPSAAPELPEVGLAFQVPSATGMATSRKPQGVASDGTNLYLLIDGNTTDIIIKTDTSGNVLDSFNAPNKDTRAIAYLDGELYVYADNYQRVVDVADETPTWDGWNYKLVISGDWNKGLSDRDGDGDVDINDLAVTADGQSIGLSSLSTWDKSFQIDSSDIWDIDKVRAPTVVKVDTTYHLWYYSDGSGIAKIGHATSTDGLSWTKDASNPVLTPGDAGAWDEAGVMHPSVVYDSGTSTYHMWYTGVDGSDIKQIGHATSSNGNTWTKDSNNPVFSASTEASGAWDQQLFEVDVIGDSTSGYEMLYSAAGPTTRLEEVWGYDENWNWTIIDYNEVAYKQWLPHIGRATSSSGVNWTRGSSPVLTPSDWDWDQSGLYSPTLAKVDTTYHAWYRGQGSWDSDKRIGHAKSTDGGVTWTKDPSNSAVLQQGGGSDFDSNYVDAPDVLRIGTQYVIWYEGADWDSNAIGRATTTSAAGTPNKYSGNPVLRPGIEGAAILVSYRYSDGYAQNSIIKLDADDGSYVQHYQSPNWGSQVGGLTTDGTTNLYASSYQWNDLWKLNPDDGSTIQTKYIWTPLWGSTALAYQDGKLYSANGGSIYVLNWNTQSLENTYETGLSDIGGLEFIGDTLYVGASNVGTIYKGALPGTVEKTTAGDYTAQLQAVNQSGAATSSSEVSFSLTKLTSVEVEITSPDDGESSVTDTITVEGTVTDPSIDSVTIDVTSAGEELLVTTLLSDDMEDGDSVTGDGKLYEESVLGLNTAAITYSTENLWRLSQERSYSGDYAWAYNKEPVGGGKTNYDTPGKANAGAIVSEEFTVGPDTQLGFRTSWDTDSGPDWDKKLVDIYADGSWQPLAYIVDATWYWDPYGGARQMLVIPMGWMMQWEAPGPGPGGWNWYPATVDLSAYEGKDVKIRFRFDSWDDWNNSFAGWYIDDVTVSGASFQQVTAAVTNLSFSAEVTLVEGYNQVTVTAVSGYIPLPAGGDSDSITVSLDTTAPMVILDELPDFTNVSAVTVSGTVGEFNLDRLVLTINGNAFYSLGAVPAGQEPPEWTFSAPVALSQGENEIVATVTDVLGLTGTDSLTITLDSTGPDISVLDTIYPIGEVSARTGDILIFQVNILDLSSGVDHVALVMPGSGSQEEYFIPAGDIPEAVRDQWGSTSDYIFPMTLPSDAPSGAYSMTVKAYDQAGNVSTATASALVTPTLSAYNVYLMPEWNLISLPLIPDDGDIADTLGLVTGVDAVWYYDAASGTWQVYSTGAAPDNLTTLETGKGYWVSMDESEFDYSAPLSEGLPETPAPLKFSYTGEVLKPATVPPTYSVEEGWNLIGLHSEWSKPVTQYLQPVSVPQQIWAALLQYDNYIKFTMGDAEEEGGAEIYLGSFRTLLTTDEMEPSRGFWLYLVQPGKIVAQP